MRALPWLASLPLVVGGCWKTEFAQVAADAIVAFEPDVDLAGASAPEGWVVQPIPVDLECPNGNPTAFYMVYPEAAVGGAPLPVAVILHSGAFDFVFAPTPGDALGGTHYAEPSRLDDGWAIRHVYATLGMLPNEISTEVHTGILPIELAQRGVALLLPTNCWGDLWHNRRGLADNDFPSDLFARDGRTAAEWAYQFATDPVFAAALGVTLPVTVATDQVYLIGLGPGGRGVGEVLSIDTNEDGVPDHRPAGALVDSHFDDLRVFYSDPALYGNILAGMDRVFPEGEVQTEVGSLWAADLPDRFGYLYAELDPLVPPATHNAVEQVLAASPGTWLHTDVRDAHILLNGSDPVLTRAAVSYLLDGTLPAAGALPEAASDTGAD